MVVVVEIATSSTAQGGGGSFKVGNLYERLVVVKHGWQSKSTDAPKGGFLLDWLQWLLWLSGPSRHSQLLDVMWCCAAVVVV